MCRYVRAVIHGWSLSVRDHEERRPTHGGRLSSFLVGRLVESCDPILWSGGHRRIQTEVGDEGVEVDFSAETVGAVY